jgi:hypothetical protein
VRAMEARGHLHTLATFLLGNELAVGYWKVCWVYLWASLDTLEKSLLSVLRYFCWPKGILCNYLTRYAIYLQRNIEAHSRNHCYHGKVLSFTYFECVCNISLYSMQSASAVLYCHLWSVWIYHIFPHYLINGTVIGKKKLLNIECVFWFPVWLVSEIFLILRRLHEMS